MSFVAFFRPLGVKVHVHRFEGQPVPGTARKHLPQYLRGKHIIRAPFTRITDERVANVLRADALLGKRFAEVHADVATVPEGVRQTVGTVKTGGVSIADAVNAGAPGDQATAQVPGTPPAPPTPESVEIAPQPDGSALVVDGETGHVLGTAPTPEAAATLANSLMTTGSGQSLNTTDATEGGDVTEAGDGTPATVNDTPPEVPQG